MRAPILLFLGLALAAFSIGFDSFSAIEDATMPSGEMDSDLSEMNLLEESADPIDDAVEQVQHELSEDEAEPSIDDQFAKLEDATAPNPEEEESTSADDEDELDDLDDSSAPAFEEDSFSKLEDDTAPHQFSEEEGDLDSGDFASIEDSTAPYQVPREKTVKKFLKTLHKIAKRVPGSRSRKSANDYAWKIKLLRKRMQLMHKAHVEAAKYLVDRIRGIDADSIHHHKNLSARLRRKLIAVRNSAAKIARYNRELNRMYRLWNKKGSQLLNLKWFRALVRKHFGRDGTAGRWGKWARSIWEKRGWKPFWGKHSWRQKVWGKPKKKWTPPKEKMVFETEAQVRPLGLKKKKKTPVRQAKIKGAVVSPGIPDSHIHTWRDWIVHGRVFGVDFDRTLDKFDDSVYRGKDDPLGPLKGGSNYSVRYKFKHGFLTRGFNQDVDRTVTEASRGADPGSHKIELWGHVFTFDKFGKVFSKRWGLVGHLKGCDRCPEDMATDEEGKPVKEDVKAGENEEPIIPKLDADEMTPENSTTLNATLTGNGTTGNETLNGTAGNSTTPADEFESANGTANGTQGNTTETFNPDGDVVDPSMPTNGNENEPEPAPEFQAITIADSTVFQTTVAANTTVGTTNENGETAPPQTTAAAAAAAATTAQAAAATAAAPATTHEDEAHETTAAAAAAAAAAATTHEDQAHETTAVAAGTTAAVAATATAADEEEKIVHPITRKTFETAETKPEATTAFALDSETSAGAETTYVDTTVAVTPRTDVDETTTAFDDSSLTNPRVELTRFAGDDEFLADDPAPTTVAAAQTTAAAAQTTAAAAAQTTAAAAETTVAQTTAAAAQTTAAAAQTTAAVAQTTAPAVAQTTAAAVAAETTAAAVAQTTAAAVAQTTTVTDASNNATTAATVAPAPLCFNTTVINGTATNVTVPCPVTLADGLLVISRLPDIAQWKNIKHKSPIPASVWSRRPVDGYRAVGDYIKIMTYRNPTQKIPMVKAKPEQPLAVAQPFGFRQIWREKKVGQPLYVYQMICPEGYTSVGDVARNTEESPRKEDYYCVHKETAVRSEALANGCKFQHNESSKNCEKGALYSDDHGAFFRRKRTNTFKGVPAENIRVPVVASLPAATLAGAGLSAGSPDN